MCTGGPWFNDTIFQNIHDPLFEEFFVTAHQYIFYIMCGLHDCEKCRKKSTGATDFHGGWYLPEDSNINPLIYLCVTINLLTLGLTGWARTFHGVV